MPRVRQNRFQKLEELQREKKKRLQKKLLIFVIACACALYFGVAAWFTLHFYPGTILYGVQCGNRTAEETLNKVVENLMRYTLRVELRSGDVQTVTAREIALRFVSDGEIAGMLRAQKAFLWPFYIWRAQTDRAKAAFVYDRELAKAWTDKLEGMDEKSAQYPQDAYIRTTEREFLVVQEVMGNLLNREKTHKTVLEALDAGAERVSLEESGCYQNPSVYRDDASLQQKAAAMNALAGADITYDFGDRQERVNAFQLAEWMTEQADGSYALDESRVADYVASLAAKYDTFGLSREFTTYYGDTITLNGGDYGWCIDQEATVAALLAALRSGYVGSMEPVYLYTAMSRDSNDIGDTYVEVCISRQRMWCYENGILMVDTPVVTGNPSTNHGTPAGGVWAIDSKMRDYTLRGEGYAAPVDYWMAFNGDVGIHDLASRTEFGGNIYLTNGSHGCVNTPYEQAAQIYEIVCVGTPVVVYE